MDPVPRRRLAADYIPAAGRSIVVLGHSRIAELLLLRVGDGVLRRTRSRLQRIWISIGSMVFLFCVDDDSMVMLIG